ncbi:MAG: GTPase HflX [Phycisphaerae bacterium]
MENVRDQLKVEMQRAVLVGAILRGKEKECDNLEELTCLAETAGAQIVDRLQQKVSVINPSTFIGSGKAKLIGQRVKESQAQLVIFDIDLSPGQIRALEKIIEAQVIDRSELILDIFATRARTKQAKLQVELAQLEYTYPRLTRMWSHLDTVTGGAASGGVGTRGTGEKQLEIDRRLVKKRIGELKRELKHIELRKEREIDSREDMFKICLVGYTNAGKSTFMNAVTCADVLAENKLFATLDTRTKKWQLDNGAEALLSDTVGFVKRLPHQLVESFKATLAEALNADLLIHIVDVSNERVFEQIDSVDRVLKEIGCEHKDMLILFNKSDVPSSIKALETLQALHPEAVSISAKAGLNIDKVTSAVSAMISGSKERLRVTYSVKNGRLLGFINKHAEVLDTEYTGMSVVQEIVIGSNALARLRSLSPESVELI